jgi:hypothetical protein
MYLCVRRIDFYFSICDFDTELWNCSNSVVCFVFNVIQKTIYLHRHHNNMHMYITKAWSIDNTQIHDRSLSWLGTCTSIKSIRVKLVLWDETSPLVKLGQIFVGFTQKICGRLACHDINVDFHSRLSLICLCV